MAFLPTDDPNCFQNRITALLGRVPHEGNRGHIRRYVNDRLVHGRKPATVFNDVNAVVAFCAHLGAKDLKTEATRDDVVAYLTQAHRTRIWRNIKADGGQTITEKRVPLGPATLVQRKLIIRAFFRWLMDDEDAPQVRKLGAVRKPKTKVVAAGLITQADLKALLLARPQPRDRALLSFLFEAGFRAGEIVSLNVGSVDFTGGLARVTIPPDAPGLKTGTRTVLVIDSVAALHAWVEAHPARDRLDEPLFPSLSLRNYGKRMSVQGLYKFTTDAGEKAKLKMRANPHLFRHSSATEKARLGWTEAMLRSYYGWAKDSITPTTYVHLREADYERYELSRRGILVGDAKPEAALRGLDCPACKTTNVLTAIWCSNCRAPVSPDAAQDVKRRQLDALKEDLASMVDASLRRMLAERAVASIPVAPVGGPAVEAVPAA